MVGNTHVDSNLDDFSGTTVDAGSVTSDSNYVYATPPQEGKYDDTSKIRIAKSNSNLKTVELVKSGSMSAASATLSINLTDVSGYKNLTADNFIVEFTRLQLTNTGNTNAGTGISISKSYNASTGVLTLTSSGNNNCGCTFGFVNANWTTYYKVYRVY